MTQSGARLIVISIAFSCALFLAAMPRAVVPLEPPYPIVQKSEAAQNSDGDPEKAIGAAFAQLTALLIERGEAELGRIEPAERFAERDLRIRRLSASLEEQLGEEALRRFSRQLAVRIERGLLGIEEEDPRLIARLERQLELHHASVNGELIAPPALIRAFALARLAIVFGDERVDRFMNADERELYYGWAALLGEGEVQRFGEAVYEELQPEVMRRARAFRAFHGGDLEGAALLYRAIYEDEGTIAARNYALAAASLARSGG